MAKLRESSLVIAKGPEHRESIQDPGVPLFSYAVEHAKHVLSRYLEIASGKDAP